MRVGNFSLLIPEGRERDSGHVEMQHNTQYQLRLGNHYHDKPCPRFTIRCPLNPWRQRHGVR